MSHEHLDKKLDSVVEEIKEIKKAIVILIRVEERQAAQRDTLERFGDWLDNHEQRIQKIEKTVVGNTKSIGLFDHLVSKGWLVLIGGIAGAIAKSLAGG